MNQSLLSLLLASNLKFEWQATQGKREGVVWLDGKSQVSQEPNDEREGRQN